MNKIKIQLDWLEESRQSPEYATEGAKLDFAVALERRMQHLNLSRSDLARKLGTSPAAITMTLRGDANLSIERMVKLVYALDARLHLHIAPLESRVRWLEVHDSKSKVLQQQLNSAQAWAQQQQTGTRHEPNITFAA